MGEVGETPNDSISAGTLVPDLSEHAKIAEAAMRQYKSFRATLELEDFPKDDLDKLYVNMVDLKKVGSNLMRLETAATSDELPDLEKRDLRRSLKAARQITDPITETIVGLARKEKFDNWALIRVNIKIESASDDFFWLEQLVALGEVIVETRGQNPDERLIRQKIGQGAWEELLNAFTYKKVHYAAETGAEVTTEDSLEEEKEELRLALQRKPWGQRETEKNRKLYQGIRKRIGRSEEGIEILKNLKIVWDCARGSIPEGVSAVDILYSSEYALQALDNEGAFDWDPEELEEEGEGEETEE